MQAVNWYIKQRQLSKDSSYESLANKFLQKTSQFPCPTELNISLSQTSS
jgi:hypothetical protein